MCTCEAEKVVNCAERHVFRFFLRCKDFANIYCLQLCYSILKIEAVFFSQPQAVFYQTARCYILEDLHNIYCHQNHKRLSGWIFIFVPFFNLIPLESMVLVSCACGLLWKLQIVHVETRCSCFHCALYLCNYNILMQDLAVCAHKH